MAAWIFANWPNVSAGLAVFFFAYLAVYWDHYDVLHRILLAEMGILAVHFWEEFGFPGGFQSMCNEVQFKEPENVRDHYPLNQLNTWIGNWWFLWVLFLPPFFCSEPNWFTLLPPLFGAFFEVLVHLIRFNLMLGTWYNPGLATSLFGFLPVGIIYFYYFGDQHGPLDYLWAVLLSMANYFFIFYGVGIGLLAKPTWTKFAFTKEEMERMDLQRYSPLTWLRHYRDNWHYYVCVFFVAGSFFMGFFGYLFSPIQTILIWNTLALSAHMIEEYVLPSGAPLIINGGLYGEQSNWDRFPGNKLTTAVVNTTGLFFYLAAVVWSDQIWLGLAQVYFGFMQVFGHGVVMNIKTNSAYNPGLATALLLHLPIGMKYIADLQDGGLVQTSDYWYGAAGLVAATIGVIVLPMRLFMNRASPYPLTLADMGGAGLVSKLRAKGLIVSPLPEETPATA